MRTLSYLFLLLASGCDIFHSTDFVPACEGGCGDGPIDSGVTPFTTDTAQALSNAKQTCAWLAACEGPLGGNETGKCIANTILAFDQTTNPNRQPKGAARTYWQCLFNASAAHSCSAIQACNPAMLGSCPPNPFVGCFGGPTARIDCRVEKEIPIRENCGMYGQACANGICAGIQAQSCVSSGCFGTNAKNCSDAGIDIGRDCASVGNGTCADLFDAAVCTPEAMGTCNPSLTVTCDDGGVAHGCQAGIPESVDCKKISGGCAEGLYGPSEPPSNACVNLTPSCSDDLCTGGAILACVRGRQVAVDCATLGLKPCGTSIPTTPDGPRPACGKP